jgi:hypothetical protein
MRSIKKITLFITAIVIIISPIIFNLSIKKLNYNRDYQLCQNAPTFKCIINLAKKSYSNTRHLSEFIAIDFISLGETEFGYNAVLNAPSKYIVSYAKKHSIPSRELYELLRDDITNIDQYAIKFSAHNYYSAVSKMIYDHPIYAVTITDALIKHKVIAELPEKFNIILYYWKSAIEREPYKDQRSEWVNLTKTLLELGFTKQANIYAKKALNYPFKDDTATYDLIEMFAIMNEIERSKKIGAKYKEGINRASAYTKISSIMAKQNNISKIKNVILVAENEILQIDNSKGRKADLLLELVQIANDVGMYQKSKELTETLYKVAKLNKTPLPSFTMIKAARSFYIIGDHKKSYQILKQQSDKKLGLSITMLHGAYDLNDELKSEIGILLIALDKTEEAIEISNQIDESIHRRRLLNNLYLHLYKAQYHNLQSPEIFSSEFNILPIPLYDLIIKHELSNDNHEKALELMINAIATMNKNNTEVHESYYRDILRHSITMKEYYLSKKMLKIILQNNKRVDKDGGYARNLLEAARLIERVGF